MKIAVFSDIHDHWNLLDRMVASIADANNDVDLLLDLGDRVAPGAFVSRIQKLGLPIHSIWGNNDGEIYRTCELYSQYKDFFLYRGTYTYLNFDGVKFFLTHYDDVVDSIARSGDVDVVFYGHTHSRDERMIDDCLVVNPGAVCGSFESSSYVVYDTNTKKVNFVEL